MSNSWTDFMHRIMHAQKSHAGGFYYILLTEKVFLLKLLSVAPARLTLNQFLFKGWTSTPISVPDLTFFTVVFKSLQPMDYISLISRTAAILARIGGSSKSKEHKD